MVKQKFNHEAKLVDITKIIPNKYNPNIMEPEVFAQTVKNIQKEGFIYPLLVQQEQNGKYMIIDGFHRWKASQELKYKQLPVIVLDKSMPEAMIATINFNKLRGEFDTLRLAEVIHTLHKTYSMEEIEEKLGYSKDQQTGMTNLLAYDFDALNNEGVDLSKQEPQEYEFKTILTGKQNRVIQDALEATGKSDIPKALVCICLEYLAKHGHKKRSKSK